ncbi:unnamed protein product, partial [Effrenium voratum]
MSHLLERPCVGLGNDACWRGGFSFDDCCKGRGRPECFDALYTFEVCCLDAKAALPQDCHQDVESLARHLQCKGTQWVKKEDWDSFFLAHQLSQSLGASYKGWPDIGELLRKANATTGALTATEEDCRFGLAALLLQALPSLERAGAHGAVRAAYRRARRLSLAGGEDCRWREMVNHAILQHTDMLLGADRRFRGWCPANGPKIFVYELPLARNPLSCARIGFWASEVYLERFLFYSGCRTSDPEEADLFFVPAYLTCWELQHSKPLSALARAEFLDAQRGELGRLPFLGARGGLDHVFLFGASAWQLPRWRSLLKDSIVLAVESQPIESDGTPEDETRCGSEDDYKAKGAESKLGELSVYSVGPSSEKGILVLPDVFGWQSNAGRLMGIADTLADCGYKVLLSDPFYGDTAAGKPDIVEWIKGFPWEKKVGSDIEACVKHLQDQGCKSIGVVGFCWGVWAFCKASSLGVPFKCGVGPHPSTRLEGVFGGDEQQMIDKVSMPVLLMPAGNDPENLKEGGAVAASLVAKGGQSITFPDMQHGWSCRGDLSLPEVKRDTELAMKHMVEDRFGQIHTGDLAQLLKPCKGALLARAKPFHERQLLMTWHGQHADSESAAVRRAYRITNETVRTELIHHLSHLPDVSIGSPISDYSGVMGNAKFCLCPKGASSYTSRTFEALFAGCIPVILSDHVRLPFDHVLNWSDFSIAWPMARADMSLYHYLQSFDEAEALAMQRRGAEARCWFDYFAQEQEPQQCSPYLAVLMALQGR